MKEEKPFDLFVLSMLCQLASSFILTRHGEGEVLKAWLHDHPFTAAHQLCLAALLFFASIMYLVKFVIALWRLF